MQRREISWPVFPAQRSRWYLVLGAFFILLGLAACAPLFQKVEVPAEDAQGKLSYILQNGILVISSDPDYAPQSQLLKDQPRAQKTNCDMTQYTANQWAGFDVEVAKEVARRMGVEPCFVAPAWSQIVSGNWSDRWDINVGSMVITPERMEKLYFTQPYISGAAVVFVNKNNKTFHQPGDLSGKRIGVCTGCAYESYLHGTLQIPGEKINPVIHNADVVGYDTDTSALADLAAGDGTRLDAVLTDPDTGNAAIKNGLPIKQLGQPVYHDYDAIAIDKSGSSDPLPLVRRVTEIIQAMHKDGTLLKLSQKYYHGDFTSPAAAFDIKTLGQVTGQLP